MKKYGVLLLLALFIVSCSSVQYMNIQTLQPGEVTFPENVKTLLILNNALPQPEDRGYEYLLMGERQDTVKLKTDSAIHVAVESLGKTIAASPYYKDIRLYEGAYNVSGDFLKDQKLKQAEVEELCSLNMSDAIVSIDHLSFAVTKKIDNFIDESFPFVGGKIAVIYSSVIRSYIPERINPISTIHVLDSMLWEDAAMDLKELEQYTPTIDEMLLAAAEEMGIGVADYFMPHWDEDTRILFKEAGTSWKRASAYANVNNWKEALPIWEKMYESTSSWKSRAKLSANIALGYELTDNLKKASEWIAISDALFKENEVEETRDKIYADLYKKQLDKKLVALPKLNMQLENLD